MRKAVVWCAAFSLLSGCVAITRGRSFDGDKVAGFQEGKTKKAEVLSAIGSPLVCTKEGQGETWGYFYGRTTGFGFSLLIVTFGSDDTRSQYLTLDFSGDVLQKIAMKSFCGMPGNVEPPVYAGVPQKIPRLERS